MADARKHMPQLPRQELHQLQRLLEPMPEQSASSFASHYQTQRKDPPILLLLTAIGLLGLAGWGRFYLGQVGMGLLYVITIGFLFIGTIVDLCRHKNLALRSNEEIAGRIAANIGG